MSTNTSSAEELKPQDDTLAHHGVHLDGNEVRWNDDATDHPRNWNPFTKYYTTIVICWLELYMTGISSAGVSRPNPCPPIPSPPLTIQSTDRRRRHRPRRIPHKPHPLLLRLRQHLPPRPNPRRHRPRAHLRDLRPSNPLHRRHLHFLRLFDPHRRSPLRRGPVRRPLVSGRRSGYPGDGGVWEFSGYVRCQGQDWGGFWVYVGGVCGVGPGAGVCGVCDGEVWVEVGFFGLVRLCRLFRLRCRLG